MRFLVTGGNGVIGRWVVRELVQAGCAAVVLDLSPPPGAEVPGVQYVQGDITRPHLVYEIVQTHQVDGIIHLATLLTQASEADPARAHAVNVGGALAVFAAARQYQLRRVVYISSKATLAGVTGIYAHPTYAPVPETYPLDPDDVYGQTKWYVEKMAAAHARAYGLSIVGLRLTGVFGPGRGARHTLGLRGQMIEKAAAGIPVQIPQGREQQDDLLYSKDAARGIVQAALAAHLSQPVYHLGTGQVNSLGDFADALCQAIPGARIQVGPGLNYLQRQLPRYCRMDISAAARDLGFAPRYDLPAAVSDYLQHLQSDVDPH